MFRGPQRNAVGDAGEPVDAEANTREGNDSAQLRLRLYSSTASARRGLDTSATGAATATGHASWSSSSLPRSSRGPLNGQLLNSELTSGYSRIPVGVDDA